MRDFLCPRLNHEIRQRATQAQCTDALQTAWGRKCGIRRAGPLMPFHRPRPAHLWRSPREQRPEITDPHSGSLPRSDRARCTELAGMRCACAGILVPARPAAATPALFSKAVTRRQRLDTGCFLPVKAIQMKPGSTKIHPRPLGSRARAEFTCTFSLTARKP